MKSAAAVVMVILSGFLPRLGGATVYQSNGSAQDIQRLHGMASDGDTITLPVGTFSWTSRVNITKGITLQGQTTIVGPSGNPTVTDATIIRDNTPRSGLGAGIITAQMNAHQSFRLTGITFSPGSNSTYSDHAIQLISQDSSPNTSMRVDHCHFASLWQSHLISTIGWIYGVADHNVMQCRSASLSFLIWHNTYGGTSQMNGNGAWADYPWYGTNKFFFIEDNTINGSGAVPTSGNIDVMNGGRYVARHNAFTNAAPNSHGTEGGPQRGGRAREVYDNTFNWTIHNGGQMQRSGSSLWHDNAFTGIESNNDNHTYFALFRSIAAASVRGGTWGSADGTSPWDVNDTQGNGTYVEGHPPHLFQSGTDSSSVNSKGVVHDSTKNWTPNQWVGYSVTNTNRTAASYHNGSFITANTANTISYLYYSSGDRGPSLVFNAGDTYAVHRILTQLDQSGRGKGDQVIGGSHPRNSTTGTPRWTHEALEPCYSWNNVHTPTNHAYGFGSGRCPVEVLNRDYYNFGAGFAADTTPPAVSSTYTAALNGVDYVGPFVYPHPLVTEATPTTDFNNDGKPDYLLFNSNTRQTAIWYLNNNDVTASTYGPTLPGGWSVAGVADFNRDGHADCLLFNSSTLQTVIWYLNNNVVTASTYGPTLPGGWSVVAP